MAEIDVDKTTPPDWKQQIEQIISTGGQNNTHCADCYRDATESNWSVWNHGIFVCIKCAGIHRLIGVHISKVKSTQFDKWKNNELKYVKSIGGNLNANKVLEKRKPKYFINPSECDDVEDVRKYYIRQKYESKMFETEKKVDAGIHEMPQKLVIGTFFMENNKKKAFFQLLGRTLYYFKNNHDSYDLEHYDVTTINSMISSSDSNNTNFVLNIYCKDSNDSLYRVRPIQQNNSLYLIDWVHSIRRAKQYYTYLDNNKSIYNNNNNYNDDEQKMNDNVHLNRKPIKPSDPLTEITTKDLEQGTILGIASKKGGGARSWRKRWWVLLNGYLYYFKDDFRSNKKANGIGTPQGNVSLYDADIIWDKDRTRTGKQNALMVCTSKRTFYIQPQQQNKDMFFKAVDSCCDHLWDREPFDFVTMG